MIPVTILKRLVQKLLDGFSVHVCGQPGVVVASLPHDLGILTVDLRKAFDDWWRVVHHDDVQASNGFDW